MGMASDGAGNGARFTVIVVVRLANEAEVGAVGEPVERTTEAMITRRKTTTRGILKGSREAAADE